MPAHIQRARTGAQLAPLTTLFAIARHQQRVRAAQARQTLDRGPLASRIAAPNVEDRWGFLAPPGHAESRLVDAPDPNMRQLRVSFARAPSRPAPPIVIGPRPSYGVRVGGRGRA